MNVVAYTATPMNARMSLHRNYQAMGYTHTRTNDSKSPVSIAARGDSINSDMRLVLFHPPCWRQAWLRPRLKELSRRVAPSMSSKLPRLATFEYFWSYTNKPILAYSHRKCSFTSKQPRSPYFIRRIQNLLWASAVNPGPFRPVRL